MAFQSLFCTTIYLKHAACTGVFIRVFGASHSNFADKTPSSSGDDDIRPDLSEFVITSAFDNRQRYTYWKYNGMKIIEFYIMFKCNVSGNIKFKLPMRIPLWSNQPLIGTIINNINYFILTIRFDTSHGIRSAYPRHRQFIDYHRL